MYDPEVGYCQAMNFIAGCPNPLSYLYPCPHFPREHARSYLLMHMTETNAFWTLAAIIKLMIPKVCTQPSHIFRSGIPFTLCYRATMTSA